MKKKSEIYNPSKNFNNTLEAHLEHTSLCFFH